MKQKILNYITKRKTILVAMALVIGYTAFATVGVIMRNLELKQEIATTQEEIEVLRLENENLRHNIQYFRTDAYIEEVLRGQLGYAKQGETVLVFPDIESGASQVANTNSEELSFMEQRQENLQAWIEFFTKE